MSSLHIINTGAPGVLFCHTFIMHARLTLSVCAGSFYFWGTCTSSARGQLFFLLPIRLVCLRLGGAFIWRQRRLIMKFKVIICSTIEMCLPPTRLEKFIPMNSGEAICHCHEYYVRLWCVCVWEREWVVGMWQCRGKYIIGAQERGLVSTVAILVSIIKHSVRLQQILIKCLHRRSLQSALFLLCLRALWFSAKLVH